MVKGGFTASEAQTLRKVNQAAMVPAAKRAMTGMLGAGDILEGLDSEIRDLRRVAKVVRLADRGDMVDREDMADRVVSRPRIRFVRG